MGGDRKITEAVTALLPRLRAIRDHIHAHPELCYEEFEAVKTLTAFLEEEGLTVERGIADIETAFRARWGAGAGPTVALLAEYDALPGMGHACGHSIIGTASCGAAAALKRAYPEIQGTVLVIGCPAEEGGGGKVLLARQGVFEGVDAAMMAHPSYRNEVFKKSLACVDVTVEFHGKAAHAAAAPHLGRNALDALIQAFTAVGLLRQQVTSDARIHGVITHGGEAPNVIPDYAAARFLIRALDMNYCTELVERAKAIFEGAAAACGCTTTVTVQEDTIYAPLKPNRVLGEIFRAQLETLGVPVVQGPEEEGMGSTDVGNVASLVPTIHPEVAIGYEPVTWHTPEFEQRAGSEFGIEGLTVSTTALAMTAHEIFQRPEVLTDMHEEFERAAKADVPGREDTSAPIEPPCEVLPPAGARTR